MHVGGRARYPSRGRRDSRKACTRPPAGTHPPASLRTSDCAVSACLRLGGMAQWRAMGRRDAMSALAEHQPRVLSARERALQVAEETPRTAISPQRERASGASFAGLERSDEIPYILYAAKSTEDPLGRFPTSCGNAAPGSSASPGESQSPSTPTWRCPPLAAAADQGGRGVAARRGARRGGRGRHARQARSGGGRRRAFSPVTGPPVRSPPALICRAESGQTGTAWACWGSRSRRRKFRRSCRAQARVGCA